MKTLIAIIAIAATLATPVRAAVTQLNVLSFGARGDGTTDDSSAIQTAMNRAIALKAALYFPSGSYRIGTTLVLSNYVTGGQMFEGSLKMYGDGPVNSMLFQASDTVPILRVYRARNWEIEGLGFRGTPENGSGATNTGHGIIISRATHGVVRKCQIWAVAGCGILFDPITSESDGGVASSHTISIEQCKLTNNRNDGILNQGGACAALTIGPNNEITSTDKTKPRAGIRLEGQSSIIRITDSTIETIRDGIVIPGDPTNAPASIIIERNYFEDYFVDPDPTLTGYAVRWGDNGNVFDLKINSNYFWMDGGTMAYGDGGFVFGFECNFNFALDSRNVVLDQGLSTIKYGDASKGYDNGGNDILLNLTDGNSVISTRNRPSTYSYVISGDFPILADRPEILALDPNTTNRLCWIAYTNTWPGEKLTILNKSFNFTLTFTNTGTIVYPRQHATFISVGAIGGGFWIPEQPPSGKVDHIVTFNEGFAQTNKAFYLYSSAFFPNYAGVHVPYAADNLGFTYNLRRGILADDPLFRVIDTFGSGAFTIHSATGNAESTGGLTATTTLALAGAAQLLPFGTGMKLRDSADAADADLTAGNLTLSGTLTAPLLSLTALNTGTLVTTNGIIMLTASSGPAAATIGAGNASLWLSNSIYLYLRTTADGISATDTLVSP